MMLRAAQTHLSGHVFETPEIDRQLLLRLITNFVSLDICFKVYKSDPMIANPMILIP
jgi:hypothetical protein